MHYANAPIAEAVIDLRVADPGKIEVSSLERIRSAVSDRLPIVLPTYNVTMGVQMGGERGGMSASFQNSQEPFGYRYSAEDKSRVLQAQKIGFSYSHLPPYTEWPQFSGEARDYWEKFLSATSAKDVARVAVRVINKINISESTFDTRKYLNIYPNVPKDFPPSGRFDMRLEIGMDDVAPGARALINVKGGKSQASISELVLDFDISVESKMDANDNMIWEILDAFSSAKNRLFEACITDNTRELIS
ncbi:TIGR04255 family protein [Thiomonas intermedia]|uniref:TIGR04255 family protein n=1 Tax=Thiomonas intermedia TaxID=926 RepID=UPI0009A5391C|nr:TIGR04255 family protein [Thiomonas intermedia]